MIATAIHRAALAALCLAAPPATAFSETSDADQRREAILALTPDAEYGAYLSSECTACHAEEGGDIPLIHGQDREALIDALLGYKTGTRSHDVMETIAGRLGDEEIAALAAYFSEVN
ncbi:c-type cytochrome [Paracoccus sp. TK19116]|uniref:C-type cytochrome n=1 Tax=Paracoccus albicereus TaxID=2922394 RepID=A0ABT1MUZ3_9RHOB|nr:c-type cytochrome [Paracoccus albicereus]MCQ0972145.1 c-type cytochrome [Paracoccus albicereus]